MTGPASRSPRPDAGAEGDGREAWVAFFAEDLTFGLHFLLSSRFVMFQPDSDFHIASLGAFLESKMRPAL